MRLPDGVTVYIGGKKYVRNIPDDLVPAGLIDSSRAETKPLKKIKREKKDGEEWILGRS